MTQLYARLPSLATRIIAGVRPFSVRGWHLTTMYHFVRVREQRTKFASANRHGQEVSTFWQGVPSLLVAQHRWSRWL